MSRGIYDSDCSTLPNRPLVRCGRIQCLSTLSLGFTAQQSQRVSLSELPHLELSFVLKLSSAKPKRSSAHLCSSAQLYGSNDKAGVFMGVVTQRKGHGETAGKQRGNSRARESIACPRIMQRRILARAECMNRIAMAGVSMANKKKEINGCTTV